MPEKKSTDPLKDVPPEQFRLAAHVSVHYVTHPDPQPVLRAHAAYVKAHGGELNWLLESASGRHRPFDATDAKRMLERWVKSGEPTEKFFWACFGGDSHHAVSEWLTHGRFGRRVPKDGGSHMQLTWPVPKDDDGWSAFATRALDLFDGPLDYGYAGLLLSFPIHHAGRGHHALQDQLLRRFTGLDPFDLSWHALESEDGMRTPSWLTAIGRHHLARLGAALQSLPADVVRHDLEHCVVLQLGPAPKLGDVNAKEDMSLYSAVARALRPLRSNRNLWLGNYRYREKDWLARFD